MARRDITVLYEGDGGSLRAHIRLARDDAPSKATQVTEDIDERDTHTLELTKADVDRAGFTKLLDDHARATDTLSLWCYEAVWLALLKLLCLRQPLPDTVAWPLSGSCDS
jgi:hypothetical protein